MAKLTLLYFPVPARAGAIRDAFRIGRVPFEDRHISREEFQHLKERRELPYGALPVMDIEGATPSRIAQSNAILRYVGKLGGLYPDDPFTAIRVDEILDFGEDMYQALEPSIQESDAERKLAMRKRIAAEDIPFWCQCIEARLDVNGDSGHLVGSTLTIADLKALYLFDWFASGILDGIPKDVIAPFAKLGAWRAAVRAERDARVRD